MSGVKCLSEVIEVKQLTHDVKEISLSLIEPPSLDFKAGQYIAIEITEIKDGRPRLNNRPYSIVSPPDEKTVIKLCVNLVPGGPGSSYLHGLQIGEKVPFIYPLGYFIDKAEANAPILYVATGTGIAPIQSMIIDLIHHKRQQKMLLYWGLRNERDLYYQEFYAKLTQKHPSFECITTLSQPTPEWKGTRGRVTLHILSDFDPAPNHEAYLCGNGNMIREVRTILLEKGMTKKSIHFEKYF